MLRDKIESEVSARRHWVVKVLSIAQNTALEAIRQPIFTLILCGAIVLIVLSPFLTFFTLMEGVTMMKDMGLATMFLAGTLLAAFGASSVVSTELENHTAVTVLSKPLGRFEFILGKYIGVVLSMTFAFYLLTLTIVLIVALGGFEAGAMQTTNYSVLAGILGAIFLACLAGAFANYFYDRSFTSVAMFTSFFTFTACFLVFCFVHPEELRLTSFAAALDLNVLKSAALIWLSMLIISAIALAGSTRLNMVVNVSLCTIVFFVGLISDFIFGREAKTNVIARVFYWITPNLQLFWTADLLSAEEAGVPVVYVVSVAGYAICYSMAALLVAMILFEERQVS